MKSITTLLAALAIGAGSLKAELTREEFTYLAGWLESYGFRYETTEDISGAKVKGSVCYAFWNNETGEYAFIPTAVESIEGAKAAALASRIAYSHVMAIGVKFAHKKYDEGYAAAKNDQPQPEIRKAIPVASAK